MSTAAIVLAAGASRRLGRPKQLEPWGDTNLLGHVVGRTQAFPVDEVWVVLGYDSDRILAETELGDAGVVENPEWEEGIASSLRVGLDALARLSRCDTALLVIADQPEISGEVVDLLFESHAKAGKPVARLIGFHADDRDRKGGQWKGLIRIADDFDEPLPDEIADAFKTSA